MKKNLLALLMLLAALTPAMAQRTTDVLDRGLVAVKNDKGVFCSWRIPAEEWYDVEYNIYRDGTKLNSTPLSVSNFTDPAGSTASTYTVAAVVKGVEQAKSPKANVWTNNYMVITPKHDKSLTSTYVPNDACCADVDGDGQVEILMKYDNQSEISASYPHDGYNGEYSLFECLKLDGTVLWWVNCGPNMGDFQNNEQNIVGYDWDGDGRAEVVYRAADGTTIHMADGTVYTVGDPSLNYRGATGGGTNWFMHHGREYLVYADGLTGKPYQVMDYPLPRLEDDENPQGLLSGSAYDGLVNTAWGDGYGHRSTKHFFGAPYLDGRKPSIFLARGIYTRHKMVAYDVDPATHRLVERWRWNSLGGEWHGQGYHNYSVADVDWDGRDEIVFGSMVIDDNGHGLSTTGLGHGDSHHVGDFDPYTHGQEIFACNEDRPNNNFRDATTSKIYYRTTGGNDDGRANMGNFIDEYPGAQGLSSRDDNLIGGASHAAIIGDKKNSVTITQNFRIYWDGDLCDESFDYNNGKNTAGAIYKARKGRIALLEGSMTNNDTKGTPCCQGDILGDWREEVIMRDANNNIRIYTTNIETPWRIYSLWHDHQYRNAMVWQMCGYNQTPHVSYYIGAYEGITVPPAPNTMTGRTEIANNGTIGTDANGKHIIMCETGDMTATVTDGAAPYILTVNAPTWVQGHDSNGHITTDTFTHTLLGGALTGDMRLVKQGDGRLLMAKNTHTYTKETEIWAGELLFDGTLANSKVWLNRLAALTTDGGTFAKGIDMHYGSVLKIGDGAKASTVTTDALSLGFGSIVELDLYGADTSSDKIIANKLVIEKKDWTNGPEYSAPVIRLAGDNALAAGTYVIGQVGEISGNLSDLVIEGLDNFKKTLTYADGKLSLELKAFETASMLWTGTESALWDIDTSANFKVDGTGEVRGFVPGDAVTFDDTAESTEIEIHGILTPSAMVFNNDMKDYTISGDGTIAGETSLVKNNGGVLTVNTVNQYTGGTFINGGVLSISKYANKIGDDLGALGAITNKINISNDAVLQATATGTLGNLVNVTGGNATIDVAQGASLTMERGINSTVPGQRLTKKGNGTLTLGSGNVLTRLMIAAGTVNSVEDGSSVMQLPGTVEFVNGTLRDANDIYSYSTNRANFVVEKGNKGTIYLDGRCNYTGTLTGDGNFTVYATSVRNYLQGNWSAFAGTVVASQSKVGSYDPDFLWDNGYGLPKATLQVSNGVTFNAGTRNIELGGLTGGGTVYTTGTVTIGGNDKAVSFTGTFTGTPAVVKTGTGDWKLSKAVSTIKSLTVKDGTLSLAPSNVQTNVCNVPVTVTGNALLRGRGAVKSVKVENGGVLEPGYYSTSSNVHYGAVIAESVNVANDGTLSLFIRKTDGSNNSHSYLTLSGAMTLDGTLTVAMDGGCVPAVGQELSLWKASDFSGAPVEIILPKLPNGLDWDTTELLTSKGLLRVIESSGITDIDLDAAVTCEVYTVNGILVGSLSTTCGHAAADVRRLGLASGIYLLRISTDSTSVTRKINL